MSNFVSRRHRRHEQDDAQEVLDYRTASQLRKGRTLAKYVAWSSWIIIGAATAIIVLVSLLLGQWPPPVSVTVTCTGSNATAVSYATNDTLCALTTECLQGFISENATSCTYYPRPTSRANCTSACYSPTLGTTQCNGAGECVGDTASCYGTCTTNTECDILTTFHLNEALVYGTLSPNNSWVPAGWYESFGCWYNRCVLAILNLVAGSSIQPIFQAGSGLGYNLTALAAHTQCEDYLEPSFVASHRQCLRFSRHVLASEMIQSYDLFGAGTYGNATFPFQLSVCVVSSSCAVSDPNGTLSITSNWKRNIERKSGADWGFHPVTGELAAASSPESLANAHNPLQLHDPVARNVFWADTANLVKGALPKYVAYIEEKTRLVVA